MTRTARLLAILSPMLLAAAATGCPGPGDPPPVGEIEIPEGLAGAPGFGHGGPAAPPPPPVEEPAAVPAGGAAGPAEIPFDEALAKKGRRLFESQQCTACHTVEGLFPGPSMQRGPDLSSVGLKYAALRGGPEKARAWFASHLADPRRYPGTLLGQYAPITMPSYGHLGEKQLKQLVELLMSFQKREPQNEPR